MKARTRKCITISIAAFIFTMNLACYQCYAAADNDSELAAQIYGSGLVPLTRGSSTTIQTSPGQPTAFVTVLALGQGTLKATLSKKDTVNDLISIMMIGYPADPAFVPGFGRTPADVAVSAAVTDVMGGYGIFFIITNVKSGDVFTSTLALKLE